MILQVATLVVQCPLPMLMAVTMVAAIERSVVTRLSDSVTGVTIPPNGAKLCRKYALRTALQNAQIHTYAKHTPLLQIHTAQ